MSTWESSFLGVAVSFNFSKNPGKSSSQLTFDENQSIHHLILNCCLGKICLLLMGLKCRFSPKNGFFFKEKKTISSEKKFCNRNNCDFFPQFHFFLKNVSFLFFSCRRRWASRSCCRPPARWRRCRTQRSWTVWSWAVSSRRRVVGISELGCCPAPHD